MVRWRDILDDRAARDAHPLLQAAIAQVAHYQIRNRGTVGGSIAHADPAAEMPGIAVTCEAEISVVGKSGARVIKAADFFRGPLMTALAADEIIVDVRLPAWPAGRRWGFQEFARRRGDFALAAAAVFYDEDESGKARNAHVGAIGVADRPLRLHAVEAVLNGQPSTRTRLRRPKRRPAPPLIRRTIFTPAPPIAARSLEPWSSARCETPGRDERGSAVRMHVRFEVNGRRSRSRSSRG